MKEKLILAKNYTLIKGIALVVPQWGRERTKPRRKEEEEKEKVGGRNGVCIHCNTLKNICETFPDNSH